MAMESVQASAGAQSGTHHDADRPRSPRIAARRARMREQVLKVAAKMFLDKGIENVSVEEILLAADLARSTFYSFFESKRDLVVQILRPVFEDGAIFLRSLAGRPPVEIMYGVIDMFPMQWEKVGDALLLRVPNAEFELIAEAHNAYVTALNRCLVSVEATGILRNKSAAHTQRLIARSAVDVVRVYRHDPNFKQLYRSTMEGMLLVDHAHRTAA
ncbi:MAG: TetR/AcrR family transcriptional regulator [Alphaproteobacteria bacterium]|nr:TetR/AcrR family transcriptional regulator [Alphaproteobacteria bacterium]